MKKSNKKKSLLRHLGILLLLSMMLCMPNTERVLAAKQNQAYLIKVNRYHNTVTIYGQDEKGEFNTPVKAMTCSVGSQARTITGTFQLKEKYRWKLLLGDVYGQYATRIVGGILFHSVYYYENGNPASLATAQFNKLGQAASHGCVRLSVADAKWIYDNCDTGTKVIIYDDKKTPGPLGKPDTVKAKSGVGWDPTDPDPRNPYLADIPEIFGVKDAKVSWGDKVDIKKGITAKTAAGKDITSKLKIEGNVDTLIPGEYKITYYVEDETGRSDKEVATYTVGDYPEPPILTGISDRVIDSESKINSDYSLTGVNAFCNGIKLDKSLIKVKVEVVSEDEYRLRYSLKLGKDKIEQQALVHVDRELPTITGVADRQLSAGQTPDVSMALEGVTVNDNYSLLTPEDIEVTINKTPEGNYLITYSVKDEAGNTTDAYAIFYSISFMRRGLQ
jgi:hypothetical protein